MEDLSYEQFNNRTLVVRNLPSHYRNKHVVEMFSNFGAVVSIELPTKNLAIEEELQDKLDRFVVEKKEKWQMDTRRAQKVVQDSIQENEEYLKSVLASSLGAEESERIMLQYQPSETQETGSAKFNDILDGQRQLSIQSMIAQLQSEGAEVNKAKTILSQLKSYVASETPAISNVTNSQEQILENKDVLRNAFNYINKNREAIDEVTLGSLNDALNVALTKDKVVVDPIEKL